MIDPDLAHLILKNARDYAVLTLTPEGQIIAWSPGAEHVFGFPAGEIVGRGFEELFVESDIAAGAPQAELNLALSLGRAEDTRWHRRRDGSRFWANGVTMRLGDRPELIKVLRDETAAKLAEEQRILNAGGRVVKESASSAELGLEGAETGQAGESGVSTFSTYADGLHVLRYGF